MCPDQDTECQNRICSALGESAFQTVLTLATLEEPSLIREFGADGIQHRREPADFLYEVFMELFGKAGCTARMEPEGFPRADLT